jgi:S1-C subfamily serine protease
VRLLALALAALALLAGPAAAAAPPSDLSTDPLDRATLLALPSVYRVQTTIHVDALRTGAGKRIPLPREVRDIGEVGTAFAVAPGWLATAGHVVGADREYLAKLAYQSLLASRGLEHDDDAAAVDWVRRHRARPVGVRTRSVVVTLADAGAGAEPRSFTALRVVPDRSADLALIRIAAAREPALLLDEAESIRTPVVTIGFGSADPFHSAAQGELTPAVRRGRLGRTGTLGVTTPRDVLSIAVPVEPGDSGAPVVDARAAVHGVVIVRSPAGGIAELSTELRTLMTSAGVAPAPGRSAELFASGMRHFWALDFAAARDDLQAAAEAFPPHTLAAREAERAAGLERAGMALEGRSRRRDALLAVGIVAAVGAAACGAGLLRLRPAAGRR